jgi:hypothetical protein
MEILITDIISTGSQTFVHFNSDLGNGAGFWMTKIKPLISAQYHVEFHIDQKLIWPDNIDKATNEVSFIKTYRENIVEIQGNIEKVEKFKDTEDTETKGYTCFMRLDNSLFMFCCVNIPIDFSGYAHITAKNLEIFDMNY